MRSRCLFFTVRFCFVVVVVVVVVVIAIVVVVLMRKHGAVYLIHLYLANIGDIH